MGPAGQPAVLAAVELTATWTDASEPFLRENVMGERVLEPGEEAELPQLIVGLVAKTVEEAGTGLIAQEKLRVSKDEEVLAWLGEPEDGRSPSLLTFALRRVGERKPAGAIEVVARHLGSSHSTVRDEAMATLVALGDPAAVDPLTRAAAFDDPQAMVAVIEAVSVLGGQDALDYLDLVATGHPEDDIKSRAIEALERLRARNAPAHMP